MTSSDLRERLSPDRLEEMAPHEKIVYYELLLLPILRSHALSVEEAGHCTNLGMAYLDDYRVDEAVHYLVRAAQIFESNAEEDWLAKALVNLGIAQRYKNELDEAFSVYRRAFEISQRLGLSDTIRSSVKNLSVLLDEQHYEVVPFDLYIALEEQANRFGMVDLACDVARLQGLDFLGHHNNEAAKQSFNRSLVLAQELGWLQARRELLELIEFGGSIAYSERLFNEARGYLMLGWPRLASVVFNKILALPGGDRDDLRSRIIRAYLAADQRAEAESLARRNHSEG